MIGRIPLHPELQRAMYGQLHIAEVPNDLMSASKQMLN
jgi:hypothetical protein